MVVVGIDRQIELLARTIQRSHHLDRILKMDIIVARAVDNQQ